MSQNPESAFTATVLEVKAWTLFTSSGFMNMNSTGAKVFPFRKPTLKRNIHRAIIIPERPWEIDKFSTHLSDANYTRGVVNYMESFLGSSENPGLSDARKGLSIL